MQLTADHGWLVAGALQVGEPVRPLDGGTASVVALRALPGVGPMWDVSLDEVHTFAVGNVQAAVHNCPLQRFDGPKPGYEVNPAHDPRNPYFNSHKTPLPDDAQAVFSQAVPDDPINPKA